VDHGKINILERIEKGNRSMQEIVIGFERSGELICNLSKGLKPIK
jgi:hypothetical protein